MLKINKCKILNYLFFWLAQAIWSWDAANTALISNIGIRTGSALTRLINLKLFFLKLCVGFHLQQLMQWFVQVSDFRSVIKVKSKCRQETREQVTPASTVTVLSQRAYLVARWPAALLLIFSGRCRSCLMTGHQTASPQTPPKRGCFSLQISLYVMFMM